MKSSESSMPSHNRLDLNCKKHIEMFVDLFYDRVLVNPELAPLFLDVAKLDVSAHKPIVVSYWGKMLLGSSDYKRHTMNIHREVTNKQRFTDQQFRTWLNIFNSVLDEYFYGENTQRAREIAHKVITNMHKTLGSGDGPLNLKEPVFNRH